MSTPERPSAPGVLVVGREGALDAFVRHVTHQLLATMQGALTGVFVSDARLLDAASLPFTREVGRVSGVVRSFERDDMERLLRQRAVTFRSELAAIAGVLKRPWRFEQCHGDLMARALEALRQPGAVVIDARSRGARHEGDTRVRMVSVLVPVQLEESEAARAGNALGRMLGHPIHLHRVASLVTATDMLQERSRGRARLPTSLSARDDIVLISSLLLPPNAAERAMLLSGLAGVLVLVAEPGTNPTLEI